MGFPDDEVFFTNVDADAEDAIEAMNEDARERMENDENDGLQKRAIQDNTIPDGDD